MVVPLLKKHQTALAALDIGEVLTDAPLADHCSWRIGGPADLLVAPESIEQIVTLVAYSHRNRFPLVVIGQGTNLLCDDAGVRGIVLKLGAAFSRIEIAGGRITAEAGAWVPQLARLAMRAGLGGLEHTVGIPGSVGGLMMMNGGSQHRSIGEQLRRLWLVDNRGELQLLNGTDCDLSYRCSGLEGRGLVVKVELECPRGEVGAIRRRMLSDLRQRRHRFPRKTPNCGSVFLSTREMHASVGPPGRIIEEAGLKGIRCGAAQVSQQHANFILNTGGASSGDVLGLIRTVRRRVAQRIGFDLRCEVRYLRPDGAILPADLLL